MNLGWKRVKVIFESHETMQGFLEKEDDTGILVNVQAPEGVTGLWFFPWHGIISVYNVDSKKELADRAKKAAKDGGTTKSKP